MCNGKTVGKQQGGKKNPYLFELRKKIYALVFLFEILYQRGWFCLHLMKI